MFESSSVLVADAGNTFVKWTWFVDDEVQAKWQGVISDKPSGCEPGVIALASVRDADYDLQLKRELNALFPDVEVVDITSTAFACGVKNAYEEPSRLGVDRWLGVIAAYKEYGGDLVIMDAGTAIKADFVDRQGNHLGGYIAPGVALMVDSLVAKTAKIRFSDKEYSSDPRLPNNTANAVNQGCFEMAVGFLQRLTGRYPHMQWVVTGGMGEVLMQQLGVSCLVDEHLVAKGAKYVLEQRVANR